MFWFIIFLFLMFLYPPAGIGLLLLFLAFKVFAGGKRRYILNKMGAVAKVDK